MPLIMTHGWPGSIFELLKVMGPLTDPTAHGGRAEDAFHLVLPTYPGYGFSGKPKNGDWTPPRVAQAWHQLMGRLGYTRYVAQGGDWGAIISEVMAIQAPAGLLGVHTNMPGTVPPDVVQLVRTRQPVPADFSDGEKAAYASLDVFYNHGFGYAEMMNTRPQTLGYALADSPVGMAAFFYEKFATWTYTEGQPEKAFTFDEMLDDITLSGSPTPARPPRGPTGMPRSLAAAPSRPSSWLSLPSCSRRVELKPGEPVTIRLVLDACGYRFGKGHRIRLSVSTACWPTVLPPPADPGVTIDVASLGLALPKLGAHEKIVVKEPDDPDPLTKPIALAPAETRRSVTRDLSGNRTEYRIHEDTGLNEHPDTGLAVRQIREELWSISPDDPLSMTGTIAWTCELKRSGWSIRTVSTARISCTADQWLIGASVKAYEAETEVSNKTFKKAIPGT